MINKKITDGFLPHYKKDNTDISIEYFYVIKDIVPNKNECNQEEMEFTFYRVNKNLDAVLSDCKFYKKKFNIIGRLNLTDEDLYTTELIGYECDKDLYVDCKKCKYCDIDEEECLKEQDARFNLNGEIICPEYSVKIPDAFENRIEIIEITLQEEIDIDFNNIYEGNDEKGFKKCVSVVINIEKEYESLYRSYSTVFKRNENDEITGVKIFFRDLKTRKHYPLIRVTIIGVPVSENIEEESEEESNGE